MIGHLKYMTQVPPLDSPGPGNSKLDPCRIAGVNSDINNIRKSWQQLFVFPKVKKGKVYPFRAKRLTPILCSQTSVFHFILVDFKPTEKKRISCLDFSRPFWISNTV